MQITVITPSIRPKGLSVVQRSLEKQTFTDFEWLTEIGLPKKNGCDLSQANNRMLRRAKGELVVSIQDYTKVPEYGLQKFWDFYQLHPRTFCTAPCGQTLDWKNITWDWRAHGDTRKIQFPEWEQDYGSAPLKAFFDVGGYDEEFDKGWSWESVNVAERADRAGYDFWVDVTNKAVAFEHDKVLDHPFRNKLENNDKLALRKRDEMSGGNHTLNYLS